MRTWFLLLSLMTANTVVITHQANVILKSVEGATSQMMIPVEETIPEAAMVIESWMTTPFDSNITQAEMDIESWTTAPCEHNIAEVEMVIESWMTTPFFTLLAEECNEVFRP